MKKQDNKQVVTMPKRLIGLAGLGVLLANLAFGQQPAAEPRRQCASALIERQLQARNPARRQLVDQLNQQVRSLTEASAGQQARGSTAEVYRIPVVVHVVHNSINDVVGGINNANITEAQIRSQMQVLNEDYRKLANTPGGESTNPLAADMRIEFFLATADPSGQPSSGITRTFSPRPSFDLFNDLFLLSSIAYWPSNRYLNIWVVALSNRNFLGFGQFPTAADTLQGLGDTDERIDGVVIDHRFFGRRTGTVTSPLYCCGRTTTHEVGHWLGLIHPTGDEFCGEDFVADTPPTESLNETDRCDPLFSRCRPGLVTRNLIEDYMDYTPDVCMNLFTNGQRERTHAVLQLSPRRVQLIQSTTALPETEKLTVSLSPNPGNTQSVAKVQFKGQQAFTATLYDQTGRLLYTEQFPPSFSRLITVPLTGLQTTVYIFQVKTPGEVVSQRLLVR